MLGAADGTTQYRLYLRYMNDKEGKNDLPKIQAIVGNRAAELLYDKANNTCVFQCNRGAYYCDCTQDVEAFTRCFHMGKITVHEASLQGNSIIILTSIDDQDNDQQLKILLDRPYR